MKKDYTHKIKVQETIIAEKIERLQELQSHNLSLQRDKESLQTDKECLQKDKESLQTDKECLQKDKTILYQLFSTMKDMIASMRL